MLPIHWDLQSWPRRASGNWQERKSHLRTFPCLVPEAPFHYWQTPIFWKTAWKLFWRQFRSLYYDKHTEACVCIKTKIHFFRVGPWKENTWPGWQALLSSVCSPQSLLNRLWTCDKAGSPAEPAHPAWHRAWEDLGWRMKGHTSAQNCSGRNWKALASASTSNQPSSAEVMAPLLRAFFQVEAPLCFAVGLEKSAVACAQRGGNFIQGT